MIQDDETKDDELSASEPIDYVIREAMLSDTDRMAAVHVASWRSAYRDLMPASVLQSLDTQKRAEMWRLILASADDGACFVAKSEDDVLGFVHICGSRDADATMSDTAEITAAYLRPNVWRRGIGTALLERAMEHVRASELSRVSLWVLEGNLPGVRFYERSGFDPDGKRMIEARSGLAEIRMVRTTD